MNPRPLSPVERALLLEIARRGAVTIRSGERERSLAAYLLVDQGLIEWTACAASVGADGRYVRTDYRLTALGAQATTSEIQ